MNEEKVEDKIDNSLKEGSESRVLLEIIFVIIVFSRLHSRPVRFASL